MRLLASLMILACTAAAPSVTWHSDATGADLHGRILLPRELRDPQPTVVYLTNLSIQRIGTEPDEKIINDLTAAGYLVLVLDYAHHADAIAGRLNADMLKLRRDIADAKHATLLKNRRIDVDRLSILCEGFRLKPDVEFARDGQRVLAMDIIYPSQPRSPVPLLMEITCDNANRMGSFSLLFCHDTLLEGAQAAGFATAMVDHPVPPPYKGIDDPMPACIDRMKAAVEKLRLIKDEIHCTGKIGAIGFSRGGPFAAILAAAGDVDAALVHGNRYDYLDLLPNDPMLPRFEKAWGPRDANLEKWAAHGAVTYLTRKSSPMFLNTSDTESAEYRQGLAQLEAKLTQLGIEHEYQLDADGRGHRVTTDEKTVSDIYQFFGEILKE